mmetsp:Transcript_18605/g.53178  ORF Transcript_18605/g.53178 Transcript_18605/m.53178 type:complete len:357 (-) Transcript_18605:468-1538(-)
MLVGLRRHGSVPPILRPLGIQRLLRLSKSPMAQRHRSSLSRRPQPPLIELGGPSGPPVFLHDGVDLSAGQHRHELGVLPRGDQWDCGTKACDTADEGVCEGGAADGQSEGGGGEHDVCSRERVHLLAADGRQIRQTLAAQHHFVYGNAECRVGDVGHQHRQQHRQHHLQLTSELEYDHRHADGSGHTGCEGRRPHHGIRCRHRCAKHGRDESPEQPTECGAGYKHRRKEAAWDGARQRQSRHDEFVGDIDEQRPHFTKSPPRDIQVLVREELRQRVPIPVAEVWFPYADHRQGQHQHKGVQVPTGFVDLEAPTQSHEECREVDEHPAKAATHTPEDGVSEDLKRYVHVSLEISTGK